jgi:hypothetical protein
VGGDVGSELKKMVRIIVQQRAPNMEIGLHCSDPYVLTPDPRPAGAVEPAGSPFVH